MLPVQEALFPLNGVKDNDILVLGPHASYRLRSKYDSCEYESLLPCDPSLFVSI